MVLVAASLVLGAAGCAGAGTWYVAPDGDDANPGTREAPWRTPEHAGELARAGDTVVFLPGDYPGRLVPRNSGTAEAPILFRAEERRTARLVGHAPGEFVTGTSGIQQLAGGERIEVVGRSHIEIRGFDVRDTGSSAAEGGWARIVGSSHITIADCAFSGGYVYQCFWVEGCEQVRILDNDMARGTQASDIWRVVDSRRVLIEGNSFSRMGHCSGGLRWARQVVVRGNVFHAGWARNFEIGPEGCSEVLVEGNIFANQFNGGRSAGPVNQVIGERLLFRRNATFDACGLAWAYQGVSTVAHVHNRTYHNVFHGGDGLCLQAGSAYRNFRDLVLQNNIFDRNDRFGSGTQLWFTGGNASSVRLVRNALFSGSPDSPALLLFGRTPLSLAAAQGGRPASDPAAQPIAHARTAGRGRRLPVDSAATVLGALRRTPGRLMVAVGDAENLVGVLDVEADARVLHLDRDTQWTADAPVSLLPLPDRAIFVRNLEADPRFTDPARLDFSLAEGSPLRDAAAPLTVTRTAGAGRILPIQDAYPFYDGYGITGERGDLIAVGSPDNQARVRRVDAEARVLRLDRPLRWEAGAPVSFPWAGAAPDIGIIEHGDGGPASVQVLADRVRIAAGESVTLRAVVRGMTPPFECAWQLGDGAVAEGERVTHAYAEARDYGVRVRVTGVDGERAVGVGYVDARPEPSDQVLVHSTFDADDADWFVYWQLYRGRRATGSSSYRQVLDEATGAGYVRIYPRGEAPWVLPALIRPRGWDIDRYPHVRIRYRIRPGTPVAIFVRPFPSAWYTLWDLDAAQDGRRYYLAGTADVLDRAPAPEGAEEPRGRGPLPDEPFPQRLVADGEWHQIAFDVRAIRTRYPDVQVLQALDIGDLAIDGGKPVGPRDEFALDEVYIGK